MSKICVVPDWLRATVCDERSSDKFVEDFSSAIVSNHDVINYHRAQLQLFKILTKDKDVGDSLYSMYQTLFVHELPDMPEIEVMLRNDSPDIICDELAAGSGVIERLAFSVECSSDGNTVYIIGECVDSPPCEEAVTFEQHLYAANPSSLLGGVFGKLHNRVRVQDGSVDKSSAFRDNQILTQLYVDSLC